MKIVGGLARGLGLGEGAGAAAFIEPLTLNCSLALLSAAKTSNHTMPYFGVILLT